MSQSTASHGQLRPSAPPQNQSVVREWREGRRGKEGEREKEGREEKGRKVGLVRIDVVYKCCNGRAYPLITD